MNAVGERDLQRHSFGLPQWAAIAIVFGSLVLFASAGWAIRSIESLPYNIRELFAKHGMTLGATLWFSLGIWGSTSWWLGREWNRRPKRTAAIAFPMFGLVGGIAYLALQRVAPTESLDDIVGSPVLGGSAWIEQGWRFIALLATPLFAWSLGVRLTNGGTNRSDLWACLVWLGGFGLSYAVVVQWACTDNITELLRGEGKSCLVGCIPAWLALTGAVAGFAVSLTKKTRHPSASCAIGMFVVIVSILPAWALVSAGLAPRLEKYGAEFSAMQFLLSSNRQHYADGWSLAVRFLILHLLVISYLVGVGFVVESFLLPRTNSARRQGSVAHGHQTTENEIGIEMN